MIQHRRWKRPIAERARHSVRAVARRHYLPIAAIVLAVAACIAFAPRALSNAASIPASVATAAPATASPAAPVVPGNWPLFQMWDFYPQPYIEVDVVQDQPYAAIEQGTTSTCLITDQLMISGPVQDESTFLSDVNDAATQAGLSPSDSQNSGTGGDVNEFVDLDATANVGNDQSDCSAAYLTSVLKRGRSGTSQPQWVSGAAGAMTSEVVFGLVSQAVENFFTNVNSANVWDGEIVGGCLAGYAGNVLSNFAQGIAQPKDLASNTVTCLSNALTSTGFTSGATWVAGQIQNLLIATIPTISEPTALAAPAVADVGLAAGPLEAGEQAAQSQLLTLWDQANGLPPA